MTSAATTIASTVSARRAVGWWLLVVALLVAAMVVLGGLTRLTGSGLSITQWQPVSGVIPPLNEQSWQTEFAHYRAIPQYRLENRGMTLSEFKSIFWWEWAHRLLGRLVGAAFLLPFLVFAATGAIPGRDWPRLAVLFVLGGLQGAVGWWMVESGLETRVSVSQYRLAIHLGVAIVLFGALVWTAFEYLRRDGRSRTVAGTVLQPFALALVGLVYLQMLLGALVAGLHAGLIYNTWPSMNGRIAPEDALVLHPWWKNIFENPGLAQFDHRNVAYLVAIAAASFWVAIRRSGAGSNLRVSSNALAAAIGVQIVLGVATLLNQAPLALAALHQLTAMGVFAAALWTAFEARGPLRRELPMRIPPSPGRDRQ